MMLWCKTLDSDVYADPNLWHLFTWCLLSANHKEAHLSVKTGKGNTVITVGRGQFLYGARYSRGNWAYGNRPFTIG